MDRQGKTLRRGTEFFFILFLIVALSSQGGDAEEERKGGLRPGSVLPRMFLRASSPQDGSYLGIGKKKGFTVNEISAKLLLIDFINTNCPNCIRSVPAFLEIYERIERDPFLKGRVKMLAIGAGDTRTEVNHFKESFHIPYPIFPDEAFKAHDAVGSPRVPFLIIARKDRRGRWLVVNTRVGVIGEAEYRSTTYLEEDWLVLKSEEGASSVGDFLEELKRILSEGARATDLREKKPR